MYQKTSLLAYESAKVNLSDKQERVFTAIERLGDCNDREIAAALGWPINRITPRRGELIELGLVDKVQIAKDPFTNRTVTYWNTKPKENESR